MLFNQIIKALSDYENYLKKFVTNKDEYKVEVCFR